MTPLNSRVCRIATLALSATLVAGCTSSSSEPASHRGKEFAGSCLFAEYSQCVDFLGSEYIAQTVENDECGVSGKFSADPCDTHMNHLGSCLQREGTVTEIRTHFFRGETFGDKASAEASCTGSKLMGSWRGH